MKKKVGGLILTAGNSSRMGSPKALLKLGETTFLERIVNLLQEAGVSPIRIVAGKHFIQISSRFKNLQEIMIRNDHPEKGQLFSLQLGIKELRDQCDGLMMCLVDHPLIQQETFNKLLAKFQETDKEIVIPRFNDRKGHPVIFGAGVFGELLETPLDQGAKPVVRKNNSRVALVEVKDKNILADIDTPEDFKRFVKNEKS